MKRLPQVFTRINNEPIEYIPIFHPIELMELEDIILFYLWKEDDIMDALDSVLWLNRLSLN